MAYIQRMERMEPSPKYLVMILKTSCPPTLYMVTRVYEENFAGGGVVMHAECALSQGVGV